MKLNREQLFTFLNLHLLLVGILAVTNMVLLTRLVLAWNTLRNDRPEQVAALQLNLKTLEVQTAPLRGLPEKVKSSSAQADRFYQGRMPANYSTISAELAELEKKTSVRVSRVAYAPKPVFPDLEEVGLDASLAGEYAPIMRYINGLERDKLFFIIRGLTFTGQQGGTVNVRLKLTTYIHAQDVEHMAPPPDSGPAPNAADSSSPSASLTLPASGSAGGQ